MKILERVKFYCEREGISQREFARRVGIQETTLSRLLNGQIKNISVLKIDTYLDSVESRSPVQLDKDSLHAPTARDGLHDCIVSEN